MEKSLTSASDQRRYIYGYASTPDEDVEGETILTKGLDVSYFRKYGFFNYDHEHGPHAIVGYPYPDEVRVDESGFYVAGELFRGIPYADALWNLILVLARSNAPRSLSFSIEGRVIEREGKQIKRALVTEVAITPRPVNPRATLHALIRSFRGESEEKALEAGYEIDPTRMTGGGALRVESLDRARHYIQFCFERRHDLLQLLSERKRLDFPEALLYLFFTHPQLEDLVNLYKITAGNPTPSGEEVKPTIMEVRSFD